MVKKKGGNRGRGTAKAARTVRVLGDAPTLGDALLATKGIGTARTGGDQTAGIVRITPDEARDRDCPRCKRRTSLQAYRLIPGAPAAGCGQCGFVTYLTEPLR